MVKGNSLLCECAQVCTVPPTDVDTTADMTSNVFIMLYGGKPEILLNYFQATAFV